MSLSPQDQAILLLNVSLPKSDAQSTKPLTTSEWSRFAPWLKSHDLDPADLLLGDVNALLSEFTDKTISIDRVASLLKRGATLGLALEKWERAGLWIMTCSSPDYPDRLKRHLELKSPAVLFGCGNKGLLDKGGLAVIGSRDANDADLKFTRRLGMDTANQGCSIVSGAARGVDQSAMFGAMDVEGMVIGVMADSLLRATTSANYRKKLMSGDLVLVSPFNPEAGFNVGNAMARNRYIYCLSDAAVVICSTVDRGGTWNGAVENLRAGWVPLWVKQTEDKRSGNIVLAEKGAKWLPAAFSIESLAESVGNRAANDSPQGQEIVKDGVAAGTTEEKNSSDQKESASSEMETVTVPDDEKIATFGEFLLALEKLTKSGPISSADLKSKLKVDKKKMIYDWLKHGVAEGKIKKNNKPVKYQLAESAPDQPSLF